MSGFLKQQDGKTGGAGAMLLLDADEADCGKDSNLRAEGERSCQVRLEECRAFPE